MTAPYLGNPKRTIEVLQKYEFVFQKKFGQNFLIVEREKLRRAFILGFEMKLKNPASTCTNEV